MRYLMVFLLTVLAGCTNKFDECIEQQKADYRQRNPGSSYGLINSKYAEFEVMCSKYKTK
jgi:hypothetical protein